MHCYYCTSVAREPLRAASQRVLTAFSGKGLAGGEHLTQSRTPANPISKGTLLYSMRDDAASVATTLRQYAELR